MDAAHFQRWQGLHGRRMAEDRLSSEEQAEYETTCRELDAEEQQQLDGNLQILRELRVQIAQADAESQRLREEVLEQDARIKLLEMRLDARTRELLGIPSQGSELIYGEAKVPYRREERKCSHHSAIQPIYNAIGVLVPLFLS